MSKLESLIFKDKKIEGLEKYSGFADFFLRASTDEKKNVILENSRRASRDQLETFKFIDLKKKVR